MPSPDTYYQPQVAAHVDIVSRATVVATSAHLEFVEAR